MELYQPRHLHIGWFFLYHFNSNIKQSFIKDYGVLLAYGMSFLLRVSLDSMYSFRFLELPCPREPAHVALNASPVKSLKKRVQDNWHAHVRNAANFPNNRGGGGGTIWQNLREACALSNNVQITRRDTRKTFSHVSIPRKLTAQTLFANRARNLWRKPRDHTAPAQRTRHPWTRYVLFSGQLTVTEFVIG